MLHFGAKRIARTLDVIHSRHLTDRTKISIRYADRQFSGTWVFDCIVSELKSPPTAWVQTIHVENGRVSVREEITRETGSSVTELSGAFDGNFYPVTGSTMVDEIAYTFGGESIEGTGRKQGVVVLREVVTLPDAETLHLALRLFLGGKELTLGNAVFRRV